MTKEEKVEALEAMVESPEDYDVLSTYLDLAGQKILARAYPFDRAVRCVPERYELLQVEIAAYLINKRGAEGQTQHTENGISRAYENGDVPASMLKFVVPQVGFL